MDRGELDVNELPTTEALVSAISVIVGYILGWLWRRKK